MPTVCAGPAAVDTHTWGSPAVLDFHCTCVSFFSLEKAHHRTAGPGPREQRDALESFLIYVKKADYPHTN